MKELNYNLGSLLDIIGFIQGLTLGVLLVLLNKRNNKSTFFLGLFLIFFALKLLHYISRGLNVEVVFPELFLVPFNFSWLLFALFFVYSQKISVFSNRKTTYWVLIPGVLSFLLQLFIFFLPFETKHTLAQSYWHEFFFTYLGIVYSWCIGIWNLRLLSQHKIEVNNYFSMVESKELGWAQVFLIYSLASSVIIHILYFISPQNFYYRVIFAVFDLIAIYWIALYGIQQYNVQSIFLKPEKYGLPPLKSEQTNHPQGTSKKALKKLVDMVDQHMITSEAFLHAELTIADLARDLNLHPRRISTAVNKVKNQNFNTYVNQFRIKKAKALLKNQKAADLNIENLGSKVGFNSKSAFYSAFKKETGITPTKYLDTA